ncbi:MAG: COX15/CtaA family protein [Cyanobium sp.]
MRSLLAHLVVALIALVAIGGATRVMEAGLACPDWPLCYGTLLPGRQMNLQVFLEWFHRLDAFLVGLALLVVLAFSLVARARLPRWFPWATSLALLLVAAQGALGAFTVLHLLEAGTVTAHLVTALLLVLVVSASAEALSAPASSSQPLPPWWPYVLALATVLLLTQCALGGAMASRWASSACLQAGEGCRWLLIHRLGAWPAMAGLGLLGAAALALPAVHRPLARRALAVSLLVPLQATLGVFTLRLQLSQPAITVCHQILAALLVALIGAIWGRTLVALVSARSMPASPSLEMAHG